MYTVMYQVWIKSPAIPEFISVWQLQGDLLRELGVTHAWVVERKLGCCESYLTWQSQHYWLQAKQYCDPMELIRNAVKGDLLGWLSPVEVPRDSVPAVN